MNLSAVTGAAPPEATTRDHRHPHLRNGAPAPGSAGFTLLEIMVVVVIVGVVAAATVLSLGARGFDRELDREGRTLEALLDLASEEAIMQGRELGVEFFAGGYRFHVYETEDGSWTPLDADSQFRPRDLPEPLRLSLRLDGRNAELRRQPAETPRPQVLLLSSGEYTPFRLEIERPRLARLTLEADAIGNTGITREESPYR